MDGEAASSWLLDPRFHATRKPMLYTEALHGEFWLKSPAEVLHNSQQWPAVTWEGKPLTWHRPDTIWMQLQGSLQSKKLAMPSELPEPRETGNDYCCFCYYVWGRWLCKRLELDSLKSKPLKVNALTVEKECIIEIKIEEYCMTL